MAEIKTKANDGDVEQFVRSVENDTRRNDSVELLKLFKRVTNHEPKMWGASIIGYDQYHYKSERSAQEGDWPMTAFSPRKASLTLYIMPGFGNYDDLLSRLGKHKTSVSCLYINKLADVDMAVLEEIIARGYADMKKQYG